MTAEELAQRLKGARKTSNGWEACCPAHEDRNASLGIAEGKDGRVLLKCHAGCTFPAIVAALGVKPADLFPPKPEGKGRTRGRIVATYDYTDPAGKLLFQVVRYDPKDFRQRRPDPDHAGQWLWNLNGSERVLYRLPRILDAHKEQKAVFVAEGEKDVAALESLGVIATCNPGGATDIRADGTRTKWLPSFTDTLAGLPGVIATADKDTPGRTHAQLVAGALHGRVKTLKVLELPDRNGSKVKDAHDWVSAGGTLDELRELVKAAAHWTPTAAATATAPQAAEADGILDKTQTVTKPAKMKAGRYASWFILPSADVSITDSAQEIFGTIGPTDTMFIRSRRVMEIVQAEDGTPALDIVTPADFRSRLERYGRTVGAFRADHNNPGEYVLKEVTCSKDTAEALLETIDARELLPPIQSVVAAPIITEVYGQLVTLGRGYHRHNGGVLITHGDAVPDVDVDDAVVSLLEILADYDFQTEGDRSRAAASFITPALRLGAFVREDIALDIAEADQSQSGKTYRQKLVCAVYGERPYVVTRREGGVGSLDESISQALVAGRPFIMLENVRGRIDSQILESALRGMGYVPARVPGKGEVQIDTRRFMFQLTSNGVETTRDLANRSAIVRIRKRPMDYPFVQWPEGDLFDHLTANQVHYLGCVFAIVRAWHTAGRPATIETRHDFRQWTRTLDWIVREVFKLAPLMDGHQQAQERVSNPALTWIRSVALAIEAAGELGQDFSATRLYELGEERGIEIPGLRENADEVQARQHIGRIMGKLFRETAALDVEGFTVSRTERDEYFAEARVTKPVKFYTFTREGGQ